jgi:prepilin-type N-terminal cleavage/methylation domain-containing protein
MYLFLHTQKRCTNHKGFTLVEVVIGAAIFLIVALALYESFNLVMKTTRHSKEQVIAAALVNEQVEIIRNLAYDDVGIQNGIPSGLIPHEQTLVRGGVPYTVTAFVRNIDDPFDGQIGSTTNDLSPADYRLVEITVTCATCSSFATTTYTTYVGPRSLESASTNGALFVRVFDAKGAPVQGASVQVINDQVSPAISIDELTNNDGYLQIIDAPPSDGGYEIFVTKGGYSSEQSYPVGSTTNPNPTTPHPTVVTQQLSQVSFAIDETGTLNFSSMNKFCGDVPNIDFTLTGTKLIGTAPDVIKFSDTLATDGTGDVTVSPIEWDAYTFTVIDGTYDLIGTIATLPLIVNPGESQDVTLIVGSKDPRTLLVSVKDAATRLPISGAEVTIDAGGVPLSEVTDIGYLTQTDWSGGDGQESFTDITRYASMSGSIDDTSVPGELKLDNILGEYPSGGELTSSTFDTGTSSTFQQILWQPGAQIPEVGADAVRFQVATNNDNATWNFKGPDGTSGTYYDESQHDIASTHTGDRYLRYKLFMQTASSTWTPTISDVSFTFTSSCLPPGQVYFTNLGTGDHAVEVTKSGYQSASTSIEIIEDWHDIEILMST